MRKTLGLPEAWKHLDMSFEVVGVRRSARTGRVSLLSPTPLHFLCKDLVRLQRFRGIVSADLRGLNLGSHTHAPALLADLLDHCKCLVKLNLCQCYCTEPVFGISQGGKALVEQMLVERCGSLRDLCIEGCSAGLKKLVQGLTALRSLHLTPAPRAGGPDIRSEHGFWLSARGRVKVQGFPMTRHAQMDRIGHVCSAQTENLGIPSAQCRTPPAPGPVAPPSISPLHFSLLPRGFIMKMTATHHRGRVLISQQCGLAGGLHGALPGCRRSLGHDGGGGSWRECRG